MGVTIGEAARQLGIKAHVLRHWDFVGVLRPSTRTSAGHRRYTANDIARGRVVMRCQQAGMSLTDIAALGPGNTANRKAVIIRNVGRLAELRLELDSAILFLQHTLRCTHPIIESCTECSDYASPREVIRPSAD